MDSQQNIKYFSNNSINYVNINKLAPTKIKKLKKATKILKIAAILSSAWIICMIIFVTLLIEGTTMAYIGYNSYHQVVISFSSNNGAWIAGIIFLVIGLFIVIIGYIFGIISILKISNISNDWDNSLLSNSKILGIIGVILCGFIFGTILLWIVNYQLLQIIKKCS